MVGKKHINWYERASFRPCFQRSVNTIGHKANLPSRKARAILGLTISLFHQVFEAIAISFDEGT